ncbi:DNA polymerase delta, subunit 4-domain-containing protein [Nemania sp. NC0429]|nr:DNA polymerase delta, subunit 4-domain-containing protein [Nemania sp. NC0429]
MPRGKRSVAGSRASGKQATLSFNHRVTKSVPKSAKDLVSTSPSSPLAKYVTHAEPDVKSEVESDVEEEKEHLEELKQVVPEREKTEAELRADEITDRQISRYWNGIESERKTKRLHQEELSLAEKILRYWDVSSQYGPCVGITRLKRWQRADRLGLSPPLEVLAVLMQEEKKGAEGFEKAHMDDILNSAAVGTS